MNPAGPLLLLVEDDAALREVVAAGLERAGFRVECVGDGAAALLAVAERHPDLVILDVMLPVLDGFAVCHEIRQRSSLPVLMLTARTGTEDVVRGLELGADDYVTKPFEPTELVARVHALLRRANPTSIPVEAGEVRVDPQAHRAWKGGDELHLTNTEFRLLFEFVANRDRVFSRDVLLERVWGYDYLGDSRLVDMAVKRLRDKVEDDPANPERIATVRGVGYRYDG
jgi:two-component system, OmpR family, response regulator MtrA